MNLSKQYNNFAQKFADLSYSDNDYATSNLYSRKRFYEQMDFVGSGTELLDIGCGDATDMEYYKELGARVSGIDPSEEMVKAAKRKLPDANIKIGLGENIPFEDDQFDVVVSKYVFQTAEHLTPIFEEIARVLKPGGVMLFLTTHPFRQYFEKKNDSADYFQQDVVDSTIFKGEITFKEPSHTMNEYLCPFVLNNFDIVHYDEKWEPCAEQIDDRKYPGFFIMKAVKK